MNDALPPESATPPALSDRSGVTDAVRADPGHRTLELAGDAQHDVERDLYPRLDVYHGAVGGGRGAGARRAGDRVWANLSPLRAVRAAGCPVGRSGDDSASGRGQRRGFLVANGNELAAPWLSGAGA